MKQNGKGITIKKSKQKIFHVQKFVDYLYDEWDDEL